MTDRQTDPNKSPTLVKLSTIVGLALIVAGCGGSAGAPDRPDGATDGGPLDHRSDTGGAADATDAGSFWTPIVPGRIADDLFVLTSDWWAVQGAAGEQRWTFDAGATWQQAKSGFINAAVLDETFWLLGQAAPDGAFLARWTRPPCSLVAQCFPPQAPGAEGDMFLIRYDLAGGAWQVVDQFPAGAAAPQSMTSFGGRVWLYGPGGGVLRFDGAGQWTPVTLPADLQTLTSLQAGPDGSLYLGGSGAQNQAILYRQPPAGTWTTLPAAPPQITVAELLIDGDGRLYLEAGNGLSNGGTNTTLGQCFFRQDGQAWTNVTPPFPDFAALVPGVHSLSRLPCRAGVSPTGDLAIVTEVADSNTGQRTPMLFYVSRDHGNTWLDRSAGLNDYFPEDIEFDPAGRVYLDGRIGSTTIWRSSTPDRW